MNIGGWTLTGINSSGTETLLAKFATGSVISSGSYLLVSRLDAANSRLLKEPFLKSGSISLANTKLLLRLRDKGGSIIDEVDDGVGAPFAGSNASLPAWKASMERISHSLAGNVPDNWRTAAVSVGFDVDAPIYGSPGYRNGYVEPPPAVIIEDPTDIHATADPPLQTLGLSWIRSITPSAQSYALTWSNSASGTGAMMLPASATGAILSPIRTDSATTIFLQTFGENGNKSLGTQIFMEPIQMQENSSSYSEQEQISSSEISSQFSSPNSSISSISSISSTSSISSSSIASIPSNSSIPSSSSSCPPFTPTLSIQSGSPTGVGSTSINVEVVVPSGAKAPSHCLTEFGDGDTRDSCNPPSHSYDDPGSYMLKITATSTCGDVRELSLPIEVFPKSTSSISSISPALSRVEGSKSSISESPSASHTSSISFTSTATGLALHAVTPNPIGVDREGESIEVFNSTLSSMSLHGWTVTTATTKKSLGEASIPPLSLLSIKAADIGVTLRNDSGSLTLFDPSGHVASKVLWSDVDEGDAFRPDDQRRWSATVVSVGTGGILVRLTAPPFVGQYFVQLLSSKNEILKKDNLLLSLLKNEKIELEFDTKFKNKEGFLAHVYDKNGRLIDLLNTKVVQDEFILSNADMTGLSFSEIFPRPATGDEEWIELRNDGDADLSLDGIGVIDAGKSKPRLLIDRVVPAHGFLIVTAKEAGVTLNDTGDTVRLMTKDGMEISTATYGSLARGSSFAIVEGEWCPTSVVTKAEENVCVLTAGKSASAGKATSKKETKKTVRVKPAIRTVVSSSARSTGSGAARMLASLINQGQETHEPGPSTSLSGLSILRILLLAALAGLSGGVGGTFLREYVVRFLAQRRQI